MLNDCGRCEGTGFYEVLVETEYGATVKQTVACSPECVAGRIQQLEDEARELRTTVSKLESFVKELREWRKDGRTRRDELLVGYRRP